MRTLGISLCLLACALAAAAEDWTPYRQAETLVAAQAERTAAAAPARSQQAPADAVVKVADDATWARLIQRAESRPTRIQKAHAGGADFTVYVVESRVPLAGQDCPEGTTAQNALYVSKASDGISKVLYPVRITAVCKDAYEVRDSFSLNADRDGTILDLTVYDGSLGIAVHPLQEPAVGGSAAEPASLQEFLARLVKQFLDVP